MLEGNFRGIQQQEAIEVRGYRSRGLERAVLEGELFGEAEGCTQRGGGEEEKEKAKEKEKEEEDEEEEEEWDLL